jgi:hypothetical protein
MIRDTIKAAQIAAMKAGEKDKLMALRDIKSKRRGLSDRIGIYKRERCE